MTLMRFDPFREWDRLAEQVAGGASAMRTMPMQAYRRGDQFVVEIDLPGVDPKDVELTVERNVVNIRARRGTNRREDDEVIVDERMHGEFSRQLFLGDNLDSTKVAAAYQAGVLTLTVPVAESSKPRRVEIGSQDDQHTIEAGARHSEPAHA